MSKVKTKAEIDESRIKGYILVSGWNKGEGVGHHDVDFIKRVWTHRFKTFDKSFEPIRTLDELIDEWRYIVGKIQYSVSHLDDQHAPFKMTCFWDNEVVDTWNNFNGWKRIDDYNNPSDWDDDNIREFRKWH